jgi:hypothetical protein
VKVPRKKKEEGRKEERFFDGRKEGREAERDVGGTYIAIEGQKGRRVGRRTEQR